MTDYNWFSEAGIEAATDSIRAEAKKWYGFSDRMEIVAGAMADLTLSPSAFSVIDASSVITATDQHGAYTAAQGWLAQLFREATQRFNEMGDALKKCADEYEKTDGQSARNFDEIARI